jgi:hypothetical protein
MPASFVEITPRRIGAAGAASSYPRLIHNESEHEMLGRDEIAEAVRRLNEVENRRPELSIEDTIAGIDSVMADEVEGWANGIHTPNRETDRQTERLLFAALPDYHRTFDRMVIEPPFASVAWTITATAKGAPITATGCTNFEIDDNGKIRRAWLFADAAPFSFLAG